MAKSNANRKPVHLLQAGGLASPRERIWESIRVLRQFTYKELEGHVNRLKLIKRQMYGRAKLDLLRQRVLHSG